MKCFIVNYDVKDAILTVQINEDNKTAYNVIFESDSWTWMVPGMHSYMRFPVDGSHLLSDMIKIQKYLVKMYSECANVPECLHFLMRKCTHYQININANMDMSQAKPMAVMVLPELLMKLKSLGCEFI